MNKHATKTLFSFLRILFTLLLCGYVLYKAGLSQADRREEFLSLLAHANYYWIAASFFFTVFLNCISVIKWKMLLTPIEIKISLWRLYIFYNIGKFFNMFLPTSFGGDVIRIYLIGKYSGKRAQTAASVIVERFTGLITLLLFTLLSILINFKLFNQWWLLLSLSFFLFASAGVYWLGVNQSVSFPFSPFLLQKMQSLFARFYEKIVSVRSSVINYCEDKKILAVAFLNSILFQIGAAANVWISAQVFTDDISFPLCIVAVPIIMFIMNIPFSIGGIGLLEFGYVFVLSLFGVPPLLATSIALFMRFKDTLDALVGGVFYAASNTSLADIKDAHQK